MDNKDIVLAFNQYNNGLTMKELSKTYNTSEYLLRKYFKKLGYVSKTGRRSIYNVNDNFFTSITSEEQAYWLGFIYADGYISNKDYKLSISVADKDKEHIYKFKQSISSTHNTIIIPAKTVNMPDGRTINRSTQHRVDIYNKKINSDMNNLGLEERKSFTCKFPNYISDDLLRHFIRGYFDGDGSIMKMANNKFGISIIGSEDFMNSMSKRIPFTLNKQPEKRSIGMMYLKSRKKSTVYSFLNWIYDDCTIYLDRKFDIFSREIISTTKNPTSIIDDYIVCSHEETMS